MTPEQEEQVRRVLAGAPAAGPMPPEVAARLDKTLAGLVAERRAAGDSTDSSEPAPLTDLESRRRTRRWPRLLVAAASVSVLGYGVGVVVDQMNGSGSAETSSAEAGASADFGAAGSKRDAERLPEAVVDGRVQRLEVPPAEARLHSDTLAADVRAVLEGAHPTRSYAMDSPGTAGGRELEELARCDLPVVTRRDQVALIRLEGRQATLVVHKEPDGVRVAEVYSCDDGHELLARTRIRLD